MFAAMQPNTQPREHTSGCSCWSKANRSVFIPLATQDMGTGACKRGGILRVRLEPHSNFLFKSWQRDIDQRQSTATIAAIKMLVPTCSKLSASTRPRPQGTARLTSQIAPCPCTLLAERRSHMQTAPASRAVRLKARGSRGTCSKRNRS